MKTAHLHRIDTSVAADQDDLSLPAWIYHDAEFFEREKQAIFRNSWQLVCHLNDVPQDRGLPHLRVLRRVGGGGARRGRRRARLSQRLPASRGAAAGWPQGPLRPAHHLPLPRLDLCAGRAPGRRAEPRELPGPRSPRDTDWRSSSTKYSWASSSCASRRGCRACAKWPRPTRRSCRLPPRGAGAAGPRDAARRVP